jgi:hypothetical protein
METLYRILLLAILALAVTMPATAHHRADATRTFRVMTPAGNALTCQVDGAGHVTCR